MPADAGHCREPLNGVGVSKSGEETFDVIVVLGGPVPAMRRRTAHAVNLLEQGQAEHLLLSGGVVRKGAEYVMMREMALAAGAPAERIVLERRSRNTLENALCSCAVMERHGWTRALVVTDRLHLPRALMSFRAAGVRVRGSGVAADPAETPRSRLYRAAYEALALAWYAVTILGGRHRRAIPPRPDEAGL